MLGAIRIAWWRERLEELDGPGQVPAEPRLQSVAGDLVSRGITGKELSRLEDAWLPLLQPFPWEKEVADGLELRGRVLFGIGARLLGGDQEIVAAVGELWSLFDGLRHCSDAKSREFLLRRARMAVAKLPKRVPRELRPLTIIAAVAAADLKSAGSGFARLLAAARHRASGRFPRS